MTDLQIRIIARAVAIRVENGEDIEEVLAHYSKLNEKEREKIRAILAK